MASAGRYVPTISSRAGSRRSARNDRTSAVAWSLQCRSSSTNTTVDCAAIDSRKAPISRSIRSGGPLIAALSKPARSPSESSQGICAYQHGATRRFLGDEDVGVLEEIEKHIPGPGSERDL